jgi:hypothetical protein
MVSMREHPLLDLGKGLRDRLAAVSDAPSDRMRQLLERMTEIGGISRAGEGDENRPGSPGSGA